VFRYFFPFRVFVEAITAADEWEWEGEADLDDAE
jgi:hypothetical protein